MKRTVEYNGNETPVTLFYNIGQALEGGTYRVSIFADGNMIGSRKPSRWNKDSTVRTKTRINVSKQI